MGTCTFLTQQHHTVNYCLDNADQANINDSLVHPVKTDKLLPPFLEVRAIANSGAAAAWYC